MEWSRSYLKCSDFFFFCWLKRSSERENLIWIVWVSSLKCFLITIPRWSSWTCFLPTPPTLQCTPMTRHHGGLKGLNKRIHEGNTVFIINDIQLSMPPSPHNRPLFFSFFFLKSKNKPKWIHWERTVHLQSLRCSSAHKNKHHTQTHFIPGEYKLTWDAISN